MSLWDKFQKELDRAGDVAKDALDEGRLRIELFRVRQLADKAAEAFGYAVHAARREGRELEAEAMERLAGALSKHDDEARRIEAEIARIRRATDEPAAPRPVPDPTSEPAAAPTGTGPQDGDPTSPAA